MVVKNVIETEQKIKNRVLKRLKRLEVPDIVSFSIIGSFVKSKKVKRVNDIDIFILLDKINGATYKKMVNDLTNLCKELNNHETYFYVEPRLGAFPPVFIDSRMVFQFHSLMMSLENFRSDVSNLFKFDIKINNINLNGKQLEKLIKIKRICPYDVVHGKDSIDDYINFLSNTRMYYDEWLENNGKIELVRKNCTVDCKRAIELTCFCVLTSLTNFLRAYDPKFEKMNIT